MEVQISSPNFYVDGILNWSKDSMLSKISEESPIFFSLFYLDFFYRLE